MPERKVASQQHITYRTQLGLPLELGLLTRFARRTASAILVHALEVVVQRAAQPSVRKRVLRNYAALAKKRLAEAALTPSLRSGESRVLEEFARDFLSHFAAECDPDRPPADSLEGAVLLEIDWRYRTQDEAAADLGIRPPDLSKLRRGEGMTLRRLSDLLRRLEVRVFLRRDSGSPAFCTYADTTGIGEGFASRWASRASCLGNQLERVASLPWLGHLPAEGREKGSGAITEVFVVSPWSASPPFDESRVRDWFGVAHGARVTTTGSLPRRESHATTAILVSALDVRPLPAQHRPAFKLVGQESTELKPGVLEEELRQLKESLRESSVDALDLVMAWFAGLPNRDVGEQGVRLASQETLLALNYLSGLEGRHAEVDPGTCTTGECLGESAAAPDLSRTRR